MRLASHLLRTGLFALIAPVVLLGQGELATVTGVVTDPAKAIMVGVTVTLRNTSTNIAHTITTNEDGYFTLLNLPPGPYELIAARAGFDTRKETNIVLETGQNMRIDIQLAVGSVTQTVEVTADVAMLNTENGQMKGAVVVQQEIQDVPLDGRDFTDIAFLVPGVVPNSQGGAGQNMSVNGSRGDNTNFYVDGFNDRNPRAAAAQLRPNIDALQEFKMEVSGFSAQYGKMSGGVMNMVLKSGTNRFHGTAFEYFRNEMFDARSFFDPVKLPLNRNQFGSTISGPAILPKLYDGHNRTFFLLSFEAYINSDGQTRLVNVPTAAERTGDFSQAVKNTGKPVIIKNPYDNNAVFPGNIIPPSMFSPVALNVLKYFPLPNYSGVGLNYQATSTATGKWSSILWKIDHRFSDKDNMSLRYGYRWNPSTSPWAGADLGGFGNVVSDNRSLGGLTYTHMFSPSLINEIRVGFSRNAEREHIDAGGMPTAAQLGMGGSATDPAVAGFPLMHITNYSDIGFAANQPVSWFVTDYQVADDLTWVKGKHVFKFGANFSKVTFNQPYYNNQRGTFTSNGVWTGAGTATNGDAFADFMLGLINTSTITKDPTMNYLRWMDAGAFINDDLKITRTLTLNLGVRWELDQPPHDKWGKLMNFVPALNKIIIASAKSVPNLDQLLTQAGLTGRVGLASDYDMPEALVYTNHHNFAPRCGFAWRALPRTVVRGGYGWFYSGSMLNQVRQDLGTAFPFSTNLSLNRVAADPNALTLANPWPVGIAVLAGTNTSNGFQLHAPNAYVQNFNLTVEREIGKGNVVEIGYVGSKGTHLGRQYNINMPFRSIDWYMPNGTSFPVPYPPLGTVNYYDFGSNSIYNAGQFMIRRQARGGMFYRVGYTYSKSIDNASQLTGGSNGGVSGALDARNLRLERARSDFDRGHVLTAVFSYQLPVGRGKRILPSSGRLANGVIGGWQLSGTATSASGQALTIQDSTINANIGESTRPNRIASGKDVTGNGTRGLDYPWFDPAAFVPVPSCASRTNCSPDAYGFYPFAPGTSGRNILDGPGLFYINTTLMKNFRFREQKSIQFRFEMFNILNHPNFQLPNRNFDESSAGIMSNVQGQGRGGPRVMQFALKYIF